MDNQQSKTSRKRVANFTADEKALLAQLIKKKPVVESKLTDGKSIAKKQAAWDLITQEFNCNANVHKRETITLKRAWDNMKAYTRKARATERGNLLRTGGGPQPPPPPSQQGAIITMVEEAAPVMICEIKNTYDSDGTILNAIDNNQELFAAEKDILDVEIKINSEVTFEEEDAEIIINSEVTFEEAEEKETNYEIQEDNQNKKNHGDKNSASIIQTTDQGQVRKPTDYIRREAVMRIKHLENKKKMEMQILKIQLEVEQIKKRAAISEEERQKILLKIAIIELEKKDNSEE